ncbi:unnamed protein product [Pleuronectes platessa]|uniref:Uncharacterized protein n=1 Tax=Pleuronectes platessa TaxID=8262 RepID=A0A9N7Y7K1_PLEPL|nr:unnamed protein product [Pleuronectes platessa]
MQQRAGSQPNLQPLQEASSLCVQCAMLPAPWIILTLSLPYLLASPCCSCKFDLFRYCTCSPLSSARLSFQIVVPVFSRVAPKQLNMGTTGEMDGHLVDPSE